MDRECTGSSYKGTKSHSFIQCSCCQRKGLSFLEPWLHPWVSPSHLCDKDELEQFTIPAPNNLPSSPFSSAGFASVRPVSAGGCKVLVGAQGGGMVLCLTCATGQVQSLAFGSTGIFIQIKPRVGGHPPSLSRCTAAWQKDGEGGEAGAVKQSSQHSSQHSAARACRAALPDSWESTTPEGCTLLGSEIRPCISPPSHVDLSQATAPS